MSAPLKAGRELDQLVSEAIFGPWDESLCRVCGWKIVPDGEQGCWHDNCSLRPPPTRRADEPQAYSTEIAAASEIVEKLQPNLYLSLTVEQHEGRQYATADFTGDRWVDLTQHFEAEAEAETAPLAICLAALEAVRARPTEQEQQ